MDLPLTSDETDVVQYALLFLKKNFAKIEKGDYVSYQASHYNFSGNSKKLYHKTRISRYEKPDWNKS